MLGGYYHFYPGDYLRDTSGLSLIEHGAYNLLLHHYYSLDGCVPDEKPRLYRLCGATIQEEQVAVDYVLRIYFPSINGKLSNRRADSELAARRRYLEEQSRKGRLGGRPRKNPNNSRGKAGGKAERKPNESPPSPSPSPSPSPDPDPDPVPEVKSGAPDGAAPTKRFVKPTLEQVTAYCNQRKNLIDPQLFIDSNDAKGWVVGITRSPMKDWKATIRTWEKRNGSGNKGAHGSSSQADNVKAKPGKYAGIGTSVCTDTPHSGGNPETTEKDGGERGSAEKVS